MKPNNIIIAIAALACFSAPLRAAEEKSPAIRLAELFHSDDTDTETETEIDTAKMDLKDAFAATLEEFKAQGIADKAIEEIQKAGERFAAKSLENRPSKEDIAKVYEDSYTNEEMEEILAFFGTPTGIKYLLTEPQMALKTSGTNEGDPMKLMEKLMEEYGAEVAAILEKYPSAAPAE